MTSKYIYQVPFRKIATAPYFNELSGRPGNSMGRVEPAGVECCQDKINSHWILLLYQLAFRSWKDMSQQSSRSLTRWCIDWTSTGSRSPFGLRKDLIESLLFPLVDYCLLVMSNLSGELDLKLQRIINSGVCYVHGLRKCEHTTPYRWMVDHFCKA